MDPPVLFLFIDRFSDYLERQRGCREAGEGAQVMERWWENPGSPVSPTFQLATHLLMHLTVGFFFFFSSSSSYPALCGRSWSPRALGKT